jgi:armadillo repeat-containing protein 8
VIGSNKQKKQIIQQGVIVPRLLSLLQNEDKSLVLRINALIIIGSLSKGTECNALSLDKQGTTEILLSLALSPTSDQKMIELTLSVLKTIMQHPIRTSFFLHSEDIHTLSRLIRMSN